MPFWALTLAMLLPVPATLKVVLPVLFRVSAPSLALGPLTVRVPLGRSIAPVLPWFTVMSAPFSIVMAPTEPFSPTVILMLLFSSSALWVMLATEPWLMFTVALV